MLSKVIKRDGRRHDWNPEKVSNALRKAMLASEEKFTEENIEHLTERAVEECSKECEATGKKSVKVERIQNILEDLLMTHGFTKAAKEFILYRDDRTRVRETKSAIITTIKEITESDLKSSNILRDNANENGATPAGTFGKIASETNKMYNLLNIIDRKYAQLHKDGYLHIHDLNFYNLTFNCLFAPVGKLLTRGFDSSTGYIRRANSIQSAAALTAVIFQLQSNQQYGGIACDNFDFDLAPFVDCSFRANLAHELNRYYIYTKDPKFAGFDGDWGRKEVRKELTAKLNDISMNMPTCKLRSRFPEVCVISAIEATDVDTHQSMEALVHNLNSLQSRSGNQVPFSSINFGLDTSNCGRMVSRNLIQAQYEGMGDGLTAIFPILIFKLMRGYTKYECDPNYDLYNDSIRCLARRFYPNFVKVDSKFNLPYVKYEEKTVLIPEEDESIDVKVRGKDECVELACDSDVTPGVYEYDIGCGDYWEIAGLNGHELKLRRLIPNTTISTMGCRTRVIGNCNGVEQTTGRGNFAFHTMNLPRLAIEAHIEASKKKCDDIVEERKKIFFEKLDELMLAAKGSLIDRFNYICNTKTYNNYPFTMQQGLYLTSDDEPHKISDSVAEVLKQSTLSIGYIGIAEVVTLVTGRTFGIDHDVDDFALSIVKRIREFCDKCQKETHLNWSCFATPAEAVAGRFANIDKHKFSKTVVEQIPEDDVHEYEGMTGDEGCTERVDEDCIMTGCECHAKPKPRTRLVPVKGLDDVDLNRLFGKGYYTNSHMMDFSLDTTLENKIKTEAPFHALTNAGHIFYYKVNGDPSKNLDAVKACIDAMYDGDLGYFSTTADSDDCLECGYHGIIDNVCPNCGCSCEDRFVRVRRITGYLTGSPAKSITRSWNDGKLAELRDRKNI